MQEEVRKIIPAFTDERGTISDILDEGVGHIGIITSKAGSIRGRHYHKKSTQYVYILNGKLELMTKDLREEDPKVKSVILEPGDLAVTPPMVVHVLKAIEDTTFLDLTTEPRSGRGYEEDTTRVDI